MSIGVADGAECNILDIIALNVRSELVFGRFSDGCTSLYCGDKEYAYLGQNWDVGQPFNYALCSMGHLLMQQCSGRRISKPI